MKEFFTMWKYTKMVVLVAVTAALYAGLMIPFKAIVLVPGFTELRPAVVVPVVFGLLFGPAGAWGAALGNLIGDILGAMLSAGSIFGFLGNFLLGAVACGVWGKWPFFPRDIPAGLGSARHVAQFVLIVLVASFSCAAMIGLGVEVLHLFPFAILAVIIAINDVLMPLLIGPALVALLAPRVQRWGLLWTDILEEKDRGWHIAPALGALFIVLGGLGAFIGGLGTATAFYGSRLTRLPQAGEGPLRLAAAMYDHRFFGGEEARRSVTVRDETGGSGAVEVRWRLTLAGEEREGPGVPQPGGFQIAFQVPSVAERVHGRLTVEARKGEHTVTLELPVDVFPPGTTRLGVVLVSGAFLLLLGVGFLLL